MRAYGGTLGVLGIAATLAVAACTGNLPKGGTGTGGFALVAVGGVGAPDLTGAGGVGGFVATGSGGAIGGAGGLAMTATGGTAGRSTVPASHRASAAACSAEPDAAVWNSTYDGGAYTGSGSPGPTALDGGIIACVSDSDCPPCDNGQPDRCHNVPQTLHGPWCLCDQCNTDQDCGPNAVCVCNAIGWSSGSYENRCVAAQCQVDADCGPGGFCSPSPAPCGAVGGYYCHTAADQCWNSTDCAAGNACIYSPATGTWGCGSVLCGG